MIAEIEKGLETMRDNGVVATEIKMSSRSLYILNKEIFKKNGIDTFSKSFQDVPIVEDNNYEFEFFTIT